MSITIFFIYSILIAWLFQLDIREIYIVLNCIIFTNILYWVYMYITDPFTEIVIDKAIFSLF